MKELLAEAELNQLSSNAHILLFVEFSDLKELLAEAEQNQFSDCDLLERLKVAVTEAEQCAQVATQLFVKKHKTRYNIINFIFVQDSCRGYDEQ